MECRGSAGASSNCDDRAGGTEVVVDGDGGKWIVNDGGTGIFAQAEKYAAKGLLSGLIVRKGLTRSDYKYVDDKDGKEKNATTFYLSSV